MTVRNIRAHQARGLLAPPRLVGRTGYYGPEHVRRLRQIRALQDEGLNLRSIAHALEDGSLRAVAAGVFDADRHPESVDPVNLLERLQVAEDDPAVARSFELGLVSIDGEQTRVEQPRLVDVAEELAGQGVPLGAMLDVVKRVRVASTEAADAFMALADEHLVARVAVSSEGDLDDMRSRIERLRVLAATVLEVLFDQAMADAVTVYLDGPATAPTEAT